MTREERENAIRCLKLWIEREPQLQTYKTCLEALEQQPSDTVSRGVFEQVMWERDVAIGQLKELGYGLGQKVEPCDDAISRKSIKQKLQEQHDFFVNAYGGFSNLSQNGKSRVYEITNCISMVVNEPSITPQQKYGKWTLMYEPKNMVVCSECGKCAYMYQDKASAFCPNCGCRMVEPQESEEQTE